MPLQTKSVITKAGDRHRVTISSIDNSVKAAPLDPKTAAAIKGEAVAEEASKKKGKEDNKRLDKKEADRKKKNRKAEQKQKKKATAAGKQLQESSKERKA